MNEDKTKYIELVHRARHSGNLDNDSWETSILASFSFAGRINPLGAALTDWLDGFNSGPAYIALFLLATEVDRIKDICTPKQTVDNCLDAMEWYETQNCKICTGRGVINIEQTICPVCQGTGKKAEPREPVRRIVKLIENSLDYMNAQIKARMRNEPHPAPNKSYRIRVLTTPATVNL